MNQPVNQAVNHNRFEVTDGDRLRWQRQAAHALTALLQNAPVLPPLILDDRADRGAGRPSGRAHPRGTAA